MNRCRSNILWDHNKGRARLAAKDHLINLKNLSGWIEAGYMEAR